MPYAPQKSTPFSILKDALQGSVEAGAERRRQYELDRAFEEQQRQFDVQLTQQQSQFEESLDERQRQFDIGVTQTAAQNKLQREFARESQKLDLEAKARSDAEQLAENKRHAYQTEAIQWEGRRLERQRVDLAASAQRQEAQKMENVVDALDLISYKKIPLYEYKTVDENGNPTIAFTNDQEDPNIPADTAVLPNVNRERAVERLAKTLVGQQADPRNVNEETWQHAMEQARIILSNEQEYRKRYESAKIREGMLDSMTRSYGPFLAEQGTLQSELMGFSATLPQERPPDHDEVEYVSVAGTAYDEQTGEVYQLPPSKPVMISNDKYRDRFKSEHRMAAGMVDELYDDLQEWYTEGPYPQDEAGINNLRTERFSLKLDAIETLSGTKINTIRNDVENIIAMRSMQAFSPSGIDAEGRPFSAKLIEMSPHEEYELGLQREKRELEAKQKQYEGQVEKEISSEEERQENLSPYFQQLQGETDDIRRMRAETRLKAKQAELERRKQAEIARKKYSR